MSEAVEAQQRIEGYLNDVRKRLRGLGPERVHEITTELRSHILERAEGPGGLTSERVRAALEALGPPGELASEYAKDAVLASAEISRTPWRLLDGLFGWATMSVAGFLVLIVTIIGYFFGVVFLLVALMKPFHPATAGLWALHDSTGDLELSLRMGASGTPGNGHELLGWWIVPLGLVAGCGLIIVTTRLALWCVRMYRRSCGNRRGVSSLAQ